MTIRVWSNTNCDERVFGPMEFELYVKESLPTEWLTWWEDHALRAGAVIVNLSQGPSGDFVRSYSVAIPRVDEIGP